MKMKMCGSKRRQEESALADVCDSAHFRTLKGLFVRVVTIAADPLN